MLIFGLVLIVVLFLTGAPIFVAFGFGSCFVILYDLGLPVASIAQQMFSAMDSYILLAVPFFMFAGYLMGEGLSAKALLDFTESLLGHLPGGLLIAGVLTGAIMGAVVGQGWASVVAIGTVIIPKMEERGYTKAFATAVITISANLGSLIPPSVSLILIASLTEMSGAKLFAAGMFPGLLSSALIALIGAILARVKGVPKMMPFTWGARWASFLKGFFALLFPVIVLGGIYSGTFTPTEAAALSCVYATFIGVVVYKGLDWKKFMNCAMKTARMSCMVYLLIASVTLLNVLFSFSGIPATLSKIIETLKVGPSVFLLFFTLVILIAGFFADALALLFIFTPLFLPTCNMLGISPLQFGPLVVLGILVGQITPPMGPLLYFASGLFKVPIGSLFKAMVPYLLMEVVAMIAVIFFPPLTLWLPKLLWP
jgi:C4-dicarboxylate transporter DctM subunit